MWSSMVLMCYGVLPKLKTPAVHLKVQSYVRLELHSGTSYNDIGSELRNVSSMMETKKL